MSAGPKLPVLEYQTPVRRSYFWMLYVGQVIPAVVIGVVALAVVLGVVPHFREIFADFRTALPTLTVWLLNVSYFVAYDFGWVLVVPLVAAVPLPLCLLFRNAQTQREAWIGLLLGIVAQGVLALVLFVVVALGLMLPLVMLIRAVSSSTGTAPAGI